MEEITRRILGYVDFKMEKGDFERFLTLCAKNVPRQNCLALRQRQSVTLTWAPFRC